VVEVPDVEAGQRRDHVPIRREVLGDGARAQDSVARIKGIGRHRPEVDAGALARDSVKRCFSVGISGRLLHRRAP
jgi:hypothetical protein